MGLTAGIDPQGRAPRALVARSVRLAAGSPTANRLPAVSKLLGRCNELLRRDRHTIQAFQHLDHTLRAEQFGLLLGEVICKSTVTQHDHLVISPEGVDDRGHQTGIRGKTYGEQVLYIQVAKQLVEPRAYKTTVNMFANKVLILARRKQL